MENSVQMMFLKTTTDACKLANSGWHKHRLSCEHGKTLCRHVCKTSLANLRMLCKGDDHPHKTTFQVTASKLHNHRDDHFLLVSSLLSYSDYRTIESTPAAAAVDCSDCRLVTDTHSVPRVTNKVC